jgi:quinol monooxygenase YgiN
MVTEIALLSINPDQHAEFERVVESAVPFFQESSGCKSMRLERELENPGHYRLFLEWETIEHHTQDFRSSEAFQQWRALVSPFFTAPTELVHTTFVAKFF